MFFPNLPDLPFEQAFKLRDQLLTHKGWVLGLRHALGLLLEANNLALSKEQQERVKSANGIELRHWIRRAAKVTSTDELFVEELE